MSDIDAVALCGFWTFMVGLCSYFFGFARGACLTSHSKDLEDRMEAIETHLWEKFGERP